MMLMLPSLWVLIISSIAFFVSMWYLHRFLEQQDIPKGFTRNMVVMLLAAIISSAVEAGLSHIEHALTGQVVDAQRVVAPAVNADSDSKSDKLGGY